jgi:3-keto-5-aminohexanoate cleavage enzyme
MEQRGSMLNLMPDMASLATGSVNFPTTVYENPPDFVRSRASRMRDLGIKPENRGLQPCDALQRG